MLLYKIFKRGKYTYSFKHNGHIYRMTRLPTKKNSIVAYKDTIFNSIYNEVWNEDINFGHLIINNELYEVILPLDIVGDLCLTVNISSSYKDIN